jgi:hypothetical protein
MSTKASRSIAQLERIQVRENRRRIRDLTDDVLRTLANLAGLIRGQEDTFQAQCALLSALGNLKAWVFNITLHSALFFSLLPQ